MNPIDPSGIVDPNAREKAIPPIPGCYPTYPSDKGCYGRPPMPELTDLTVEAVVKALKKKARKR